ncbi:hypothetical protein ACHAXA_000412 [Cyclostephanos tholiformis]|uniref:Uncharacterized protein n=1 Tax=Cyclostephanos tholiformis TaxID=382380 RepID=A0ABD3RF50_9STRA
MNHRGGATSTTSRVRTIEGWFVEDQSSSANANHRTAISRLRAIVALSSLLLSYVMLSSYRESRVLSPSYSTYDDRLDRMSMAELEAFHSYEQNAPLFEAVNSNDVELVRTLLRDGIGGGGGGERERTIFYNVNAEDESGITPLILATLSGNVQLVNLLLTNGARAQPPPGFRHTPLRAACLTGNAQLIRLLLDMGADPNAASEGGRTPLMGACYLRPQYDEGPDRIQLSFGAVSLLLADARTDPSLVNDFGESALDLCRERMYNKSMALIRDSILGGKKKMKKRTKGGKLLGKLGKLGRRKEKPKK